MLKESDWGLWTIRTLLTAVVVSATAGVTVWAVGDRLLTHALSGFKAAIEKNTVAVSALHEDTAQLRGQIERVGDDAINRFVQALERTSEIEVHFTGDFDSLVSEFKVTNERLTQLVARVDSTVTELSGIRSLLATSAADQAAFRSEVRARLNANAEMLEALSR